MSIRLVINCFIVSVIFSVIAPFFAMVTFVPKEGEVVYDLESVEYAKLKEMTQEEANKYLNNDVKTIRLTGFDRITYLFTQPSIGFIYLKAAMFMFIPIFIATVTASYLNMKRISMSAK